MNYKLKLKNLILASGGQIEDDLFVTKPGCIILNNSSVSNIGLEIYKKFNIDQTRSEYEQIAEFKSRITYLSFTEDAINNSEAYNKKMAQELQHLSVHGAYHIEFLIAGISLETALELISHTEAKVGRLTSSKTKAMNDTLYRIQGSLEERNCQKDFILKFLALKQKNLDKLINLNNEFNNMLNLGVKATALVYSMSLKDLHKLFIGRLSDHGNETEVQEICSIMCQLLQPQYPLVIRTVDEYYALNNSEKYKL